MQSLKQRKIAELEQIWENLSRKIVFLLLRNLVVLFKNEIFLRFRDISHAHTLRRCSSSRFDANSHSDGCIS